MADQQISSAVYQEALARALLDNAELNRKLALHIEKLTEFVGFLAAKVEGNSAVAAIVDDNEDQAQAKHWAAASKEVIAHAYDQSQRYVTVVIAAAYAAYFTTLSAVVPRLSDNELRSSAMFMTISLTVFVLWEVVNMGLVSFNVVNGNLEKWMENGKPSTFYRVAWFLTFSTSVLTGLIGIAFSLVAYLRGLGLF